MHRRFLNKRVKTGDNETEIETTTETDNDNNNNTKNGDNMMRVPLRRSNSSGQPGGAQRTRSKIATISEDSPLETTATSVTSQDPKKRNGVRRTRSDTAKSSSNTLAMMSKATATPSSTTSSTPVKKGEKVKKPSTKKAGGNGTVEPTQNGVIPSKKSVHWNHRVEKKRHHRVVDLSQEEKEAVWYTENDTKIILAMAKVTVKMMMKGEPCDDVDYCSRGLEGKTPAGSKQRQKNKLRVRKALLEEQEIQREEGIRDDEFLGEVSRKNSRDVCIHARNTAIRDEEAIRDYLGAHRDSSKPLVQPRRGLRR